MKLTTCVLVEHVFPFLDRATYDACRFLDKDIFQLSEQISDPAWPSHGSINLEREIACFAVSEHLLAVGCETGEVILVVRKTMKRFLLQKEHTMAIVSIQLSPDETLLATGSVDGSIRLWRLRDKHQHDGDNEMGSQSFWETSCSSIPVISSQHTTTALKTRPRRTKSTCSQKHDCPNILLPNHHRRPVHSLIFDPTSQHLISAADEPTIYVWNTRTGDFEHQLRDKWEYPRSLSLSPTGQGLVMQGSSGSLRLFDSYLSSTSNNDNKMDAKNHGGGGGPEAGRTLDGGFPQQLSEIQFSNDEHFLFGRSGQQIYTWNIPSGTRNALDLGKEQQTIVAITISPQCDAVARVTSDGRLLISRISHFNQEGHNQIYVSSQQLTTPSAYPGQYLLKFTCNGRSLITVNCRPGIVEFWDVSP